jgi:hypothetical protein
MRVEETEGGMSLRTALASLPDDRATAGAVREIVAFFSAHRKDEVEEGRVVRATGLSRERVEPVVDALCLAGVLHCDGDPRLHGVSFDPDNVLELEVDRFLRTAGMPTTRLQASVGRYRNRLG